MEIQSIVTSTDAFDALREKATTKVTSTRAKALFKSRFKYELILEVRKYHSSDLSGIIIPKIDSSMNKKKLPGTN